MADRLLLGSADHTEAGRLVGQNTRDPRWDLEENFQRRQETPETAEASGEGDRSRHGQRQVTDE